jgi:hypothetical protein
VEIEIFVHFSPEEKEILRCITKYIHKLPTTETEQHVGFLLLSQAHVPYSTLIKAKALIKRLEELADESFTTESASALLDRSVAEMERMRC